MNKYLKALKMTLKVIAVIVGLCIGGVTLYIGNIYYERHEPFKVTDPLDPRFDPYQFEFDDYGSDQKLESIMQKIFYVGIPREEVEKIIIGGGAKITRCYIWNKPEKPSNEVCYVWKDIMDDAYVCTFTYDKNNKLVEARQRETTVLVPHPNNPKPKEGL